jgi:hypothetical protein
MVNVAGLQDMVIVERGKLPLALKATERAGLAATHAAQICSQAKNSFLAEAARLEQTAFELRMAL